MKIQALYNAGVRLVMNGITLMFDALEEGYPPYAASGPEVLALPADALLFTHKHPDHFDARRVMEYLALHPNCRVYGGGEVTAALRKMSAPEAALCEWRPNVPVEMGNGLFLTAVPTRHMGPEYRHKEHYSLLLDGEFRLLVAGDAAPVHNNFEPGGVPVGHVDLMIAPYPYVLYEPAQRMFERVVWTEALAANHIPEPDAEGVRDRLWALPTGARSYRVEVTRQNTISEMQLEG